MIRFTTRIHEAASKDEARPALTHVQVRGGYAYATDSYVLAKAPVEHDEEGTLPATAVKRAWTATGKSTLSHPVSLISSSWQIDTPKGIELFPDTFNGSTFPKCDDLLVAATDRLIDNPEAITIGIDVARLLQAARAVNRDGLAHVRLTLDRDSAGTRARPVLVRPFDVSNDAVAIVMPMRVDR